MWQDTVITIGSIGLASALLPMVFGGQKPALSTAISTAIILGTFAVTYSTLSLTFSAITTAVTAALWMILAVQAYRRKLTK